MKSAIILALALGTPELADARDTARAEIEVPADRQLQGISADDAALLLSKLEDAQARLRAGEFQSFHLLAGSVASYDQTRTSPREAFLSIPFEEVWTIERVETDTRNWQPFRLAYAPNGLGQLYWEIEVVLSFSGNIQQITLIYKSPAPF